MHGPRIESFKRPDWEPLPYDGVANVEGRVLFFDEKLGLALLRFGEHANIHPHAGPNDTVVSCLEGHGFTRVGEDVAELRFGRDGLLAGRRGARALDRGLDDDDAHVRAPAGRQGRDLRRLSLLALPLLRVLDLH